MPTPNAQTKETAYLGGHQYELTGPVGKQYASQSPPLFRQGEQDETNHPSASIISWKDQRGGIGIDVMGDEQDNFRCWFATTSLRHKGHIVLQRQATKTAEASVGGGVSQLIDAFNKVYAVGTFEIQEYDNSGDSWATRHNMSDAVSDAINVPLGNTETLVFARSSGVDYSTDGTTWSQNETNIVYMTWWRDLLWGICSDGRLNFTSDLSGDWTNVATFSPERGTVTSLFTGPNREGFESIYTTAQDGLYEYDNTVERFVKVKAMSMPFHPDNGKGALAWRDSIYFPAGQAIYRYTPGQQNAVDLVGPDRDDGLPEENQGTIQKLVTTHNDLIAVLGPTSQTQSAAARPFSGATAGPLQHRGGRSGAVTTGSGGSIKGLVLGWNQLGWEVKWRDDAAQGSMQVAVVSYAYSQYRLWWAAGPSVYWMEIPVGIVNPNRVSTTARTDSGIWETPWFTANVVNFQKTGLGVHIDSQHPTSSETVTLTRALNYDDNSSAYTTVGVKSESGDQEFFLPVDATPEGEPFEAFKLRAKLKRGAGVNDSPDIKSVGLIFDKRVEPLWAFSLQVNLRSNVQGRTWREQRDSLEALAESKKLVRFTYRDERDNDQVFWVKLTGLTFIDQTGQEPANMAQVILSEVH